ncbi:DUF202 domain-containing protein [Nocardia cyriacigeorgica]|uniref:DUF202 domain-containing protein n=1 Tax=Nocardia cyriacigeorgica TaxID=135487 RepID=A0A4U8VYI5_9NOCA|nr:DUF202 domain-containing protein [Nocardia cyriacigeorgica]MBF6097201.1 DUF202 domain-containing protein [Nocardia cyriacigeorgica]MBF6158676.1 DUF202 domain-containing protein [Nocardia cyriacigeorgica]MBF6197637.1 DUF202 domain-containing protein [Nocardia cyriacigeorgica]MBF6316502.1 DUF202 domain-containing protein [Nocardia cyriacigeorgica]MBF6344962.1 DUF202 domain-containing protein [Nocardia cyriacigeorgica]
MTRSGLAAERTALAWRRSALGATAVTMLLLNVAVVDGWRATSIAPLAAALTMAVLAVVGTLRSHDLRHGRNRHGALAVRLAMASTALTALVAVVIGVTHPIR